MSGDKDRHHLLWPRQEYRTRHEKALRGLLVVESDIVLHRELHALVPPPKHPDTGITLCVLDYLQEKDPKPYDRPLYAVDRLVKLRNTEALELADHFTRQLGMLGIGYGE